MLLTGLCLLGWMRDWKACHTASHWLHGIAQLCGWNVKCLPLTSGHLLSLVLGVGSSEYSFWSYTSDLLSCLFSVCLFPFFPPQWAIIRGEMPNWKSLASFAFTRVSSVCTVSHTDKILFLISSASFLFQWERNWTQTQRTPHRKNKMKQSIWNWPYQVMFLPSLTFRLSDGRYT